MRGVGVEEGGEEEEEEEGCGFCRRRGRELSAQWVYVRKKKKKKKGYAAFVD